MEIRDIVFTQGDSKILPGNEEGSLAWISGNIRLESITPTPSEKPTVGSLDMGGTGCQIAFECTDDCSDTLDYDLYGQTYKVAGYSDTCYGLETAMQRFIISLIYQAYKDNSDAIDKDLKNPCMTYANAANPLRDDWLVSFPSTLPDLLELVNSPCTTPVDKDFVQALENFNLNFTHVPSWVDQGTCDLANEVITTKDSCERLFGDLACFDRSRFQKPAHDFIAVSSYYWEFARLLGMENGSSGSFEDVKSKIDGVCAMSGPGDSKMFSETDCWEVSYVFQVLTDVYGFDANNFESIQFVDGGSDSWTLGFMIDKTNDL